MKTSKKVFILLGAVLVLVLIVLMFIKVGGKTEKDIHKVSVIVSDSEDTQWASFKYGLRMAAEDKGLEVFTVSTGAVLTLEEEKTAIEQEIDNGADAVIVEPVPGAATADMLKKIEKKVPVMLVRQTETEEQGVSAFPVTEADNYQIGVDLAKEVLRDYDGNIQGKTIGLFMSSVESEAIASREKGFWDYLKDAEVTLGWSLAETEEGMLEQQPAVDFVIALDNNGLEEAGKCAAANNLHGALVYGIGNSTEAVYYLDTGKVECIVVPDAFNMGYQSLAEIAEKLLHYSHKMQSSEVSYTVMRKNDLFSEENQNVLFTMSQ
ncbi:MAG: substrate-binding domain-containing protein [Lachnospiraceae bacterium]|nr:substrate-binding domain-containing protein [Lachnospiraceae bacterium]